MRARLWGTRGSVPSGGPDTADYGGDTASVEIRGDAGEGIILDAGLLQAGADVVAQLGVVVDDQDSHRLAAHGRHGSRILSRAACPVRGRSADERPVTLRPCAPRRGGQGSVCSSSARR